MSGINSLVAMKHSASFGAKESAWHGAIDPGAIDLENSVSLISEYVPEFDQKIARHDFGAITDSLMILFRDETVEEERSNALLKEFLALIIAYRDLGNPKEALHEMRRVWSVRQHRDLCLEILVLIVIILESGEEFAAFRSSVDNKLLSDKHILLLFAGGHQLINDIIPFAAMLSQVTPENLDGIPSFLSFRDKLAGILMDILKDLAEKTATATGNEKIAAFSHDLAAQRLAQRLISVVDINEFNHMLIALAFGPNVVMRVPTNIISNAIIDLSRQMPPDERSAVMLRLLVAIGEVEKADLLARQLENSAIALNPDYLKGIFKLSEFPGMAEWRPKAIARGQDFLASGGGNWHFQKSSVQAREVHARLLAINNAPDDDFRRANVLPRTVRPSTDAQEKGHLLVGLFGQARFPTYVLPALFAHIGKQVEPLVAQGWKISYAASSWDKIGQRAIHDHDAAYFIQERLPHEINHELTKLPISTVEHIRNILPDTVRACAENGAAVTAMSGEYLSEALGRHVHAEIGSDQRFMAEIGKSVSDSFHGDSNVVNQVRMWNRLAKLRGLAQSAAADAGREITHVLMARMDLLFLEDQLWPNMIAPGLASEPNFIFADHDPHANFIEGLGDRVMFCDMAGFHRVTDGERLIRHVLEGGEKYACYRQRFHAHSFLETILFESDVRITRVPWQNIRHEIYRGRLKLADVRESLRSDLSGNHGELWRFAHLV